MKTKFLLFIIFALTTVSCFAQQERTNVGTFLGLLDARENEFKDIKGEKTSTDAAISTDYYACKETFGANVEALLYETKNNRSKFISYFDYADTKELTKAIPVLTDVLKAVNLLSKDSYGAYKGYDYKTADGQDVTEVIDREGFLVLRIVTAAENKSLSIIFYSSSFGKP